MGRQVAPDRVAYQDDAVIPRVGNGLAPCSRLLLLGLQLLVRLLPLKQPLDQDGDRLGLFLQGVDLVQQVGKHS